MNSFYWHDYETFGVNPAKDRPSQFAGVRTDEDLNIVGEPMTIYCKPATDVLPSPEACLITGITPQLTEAKGIIEAEFIRKIHHQLAEPGTCGVGYNSIRFDDEVTRYTLYRNFYDPYAREWQNGCSRWDIIDLARMTAALRPEGIEWPRNEEGKRSFRLELLTKANGISHESAHDALSDVYATIDLARLLNKHQPKLYQWYFSLRKKNAVLDLVDVRGGKPLVHTTQMYSPTNVCTSVVLPLGFEAQNRSSLLVYDLRVDPTEFLELDSASILNRIFVANDQLESGQNRLPVKSLKVNKSPAVAPMSTLTPDAIERIAIDLDDCANHRQILLDHPDFTKRVLEAFSAREFPAQNDVDAALYQGFFSDGDKTQISRIRSASPAELNGRSFNFSDNRLEDLLFRYRARNWPETLDQEELKEWEGHCFERFQNKENGLEAYFAKIAELRIEKSGDNNSIRTLDALVQWGDQRLSGS